MFAENCPALLLWSFLFVALVNSLLASCTAIYYQNTSTGRLSHSQLRIKQGTATFEHRLNVFSQSFIFSFITLRVYLFTVPLWLVICSAHYFW